MEKVKVEKVLEFVRSFSLFFNRFKIVRTWRGKLFFQSSWEYLVFEKFFIKHNRILILLKGLFRSKR